MDNSYYLSLLLYICFYVILTALLYDLFISKKYYYLKFTFYITYMAIICTILIPVGLCRPKQVTNLILGSYLCRPVSKIIGINWKVIGKENLSKDESCIFVSNHQSSLDILGLFELWPIMKKCTVIAKMALLFAGPFGITTWLFGLIFIKRGGKVQTTEFLENAMRRLKSLKIKLWVFPEGTRRCTGKIHDFKKGAFYLAIKEQVPIVPVVFSQYYFLDDSSHTFHSGDVFIKALPAISTKGKTIDDVDSLIESTRKQMDEAFKEITQQTTTNNLQ